MLKRRLTYLWKQYSYSFDPETTIEACRPINAGVPVIVFCGFILLAEFLPGLNAKVHILHSWAPFSSFLLGGIFSFLSWRFGARSRTTLAILQLFETALYSLSFLCLTACTSTPPSYAFAALYVLMLLYWGTHYGFSIIGFINLSAPPIALIILGFIEDVTAMMVATGLVFFISASSLTASRRSHKHQTWRTEDILKQLEKLISVQKKITGKNTNARVVGMVHNLKNDLLPCYLDLEEIQDQIKNPNTIHAVQRTLSDIKKIVSDLETFLKQIEFEKKDELWFPIDELVEELEILLAKSIESGTLYIGDIPAVFVDGHVNSIALAFRNLVENALEAGATKVRLETTIREDNQIIALSIIDNGPGLPVPIKNRLFKPYNTYGKPHGVGLGIYLASQIILANRGELSLKRSNTEGTHFVIELCTVDVSAT